MRLLSSIPILFFALVCNGAGLGVYNPAQHAVNGFMPTQLPGLQLWLDAGRQGYTNNTSVAEWNDSSVSLRKATNGTSSQQPLFVNSALNGRAGIRFDGVDDWMHTSTPALATNGIGYLAVVAKQISKSGDRQIIFGQYSVGVAGRSIVVYDMNSTNGAYLADNINPAFTLVTNASGPSGNFNQFTNMPPTILFAFNNSGTTSNASVYSKGQLKEAGTLNNIQNTNSTLGNAYQLSLYFKGDFMEVVSGTNAASDYQIQQLQRYLGTKYGIVVQ